MSELNGYVKEMWPESFGDGNNIDKQLRILSNLFGEQESAIEQAFNEIFASSCSELTINRWERLVKVTASSNDLNVRRIQVLSRFYGNTRPKETLKKMLSSIVKEDVQIRENVADDSFNVVIPLRDDYAFADLVTVIEERKPAHLMCIFSPTQREKIIINDHVFVNERTYHLVKEMRVGLPVMKSQIEVEL